MGQIMVIETARDIQGDVRLTEEANILTRGRGSVYIRSDWVPFKLGPISVDGKGDRVWVANDEGQARCFRGHKSPSAQTHRHIWC